MGMVIFIGAGPGAADLITVRGARQLASADVVLHDALIDPALRELAPQAQWVAVGKRGFAPVPESEGCAGYDSTSQAAINAALLAHARSAEVVVRLKGGDPSIFGRLEEELQTLAAAGIECEVTPGITAALAAAAATLRPLTRRGIGRSVALSTAMTRSGTLRATHSADTEVFYMAGRQLMALGGRLAEAGWPAHTPVLVVSQAGWPDQRVSEHRVDSLGDASAVHQGRPTIVTVGAGARAAAPTLRPPGPRHHPS